MKTYSELIKLHSFENRIEYLMLNGFVGESTFGFDRYVNQTFYRSAEWRRCRRDILIRDQGCDLGVSGLVVVSGAIVHHIEPITVKDIELGSPRIFDPENLITVSRRTHEIITYGIRDPVGLPAERKRGDTCPWRKAY